MSASAFEQLLEAVTDAITAAAITPEISGAPAITATTAFVAEFELGELGDAKITVVPSAQTSELSGRDAYRMGYAVDVGIHRRCRSDDETRAMIRVAEQVSDLLAATAVQVGSMRLGRPTEVRVDPLYSTDLLREKRTFLSVVRALYPAVRDVP